MAILENVEIQWAQVYRPNRYGAWSVEAVRLSKENREKLKELGLKVTNKDDDREFFINFKKKASYTKKATGEVVNQLPPEVIDANLRPFSGGIGNGTIANIKFDVFGTINPETKEPITTKELKTLQIVHLVPYKRDRGEDEELSAVDGFDSSNYDEEAAVAALEDDVLPESDEFTD